MPLPPGQVHAVPLGECRKDLAEHLDGVESAVQVHQRLARAVDLVVGVQATGVDAILHDRAIQLPRH